jgi:arylsulfatase A-like enzyme
MPVFSHLDFGELLESESVIDGRWKLIRTRDPSGSWAGPVLYNLRSDPLELKNLAPEKPRIRARLEKLLDERDQISPAWPVRAAEVDAILLQQLEALGYKR